MLGFYLLRTTSWPQPYCRGDVAESEFEMPPFGGQNGSPSLNGNRATHRSALLYGEGRLVSWSG